MKRNIIMYNIVQYAVWDKEFSLGTIQKASGLTEATTRKYLAMFIKMGLIKKFKDKELRGTQYRWSDKYDKVAIYEFMKVYRRT